MDEDKVSKWIKNNTYDFSEYNDYDKLYRMKNLKKLTISIIIPILEEEKTIGNILTVLLNELVEKIPLIDEIIVIDGGSKDSTIDICNSFVPKIRLIHEKDVLSNFETNKGKGNQLWKGLYSTNCDIVTYMDSDLKNFHERFAVGILGPLLMNDNIKFVKGFYDRKITTSNISSSNNGGRVTELCARPMINMIYPDLSGFIQPLGGEYGGYTNILRKVHYSSGYGVEVKLLIEIYEKFGLDCMAQINLYSKEHNHQPLNALTKMSCTIMKTILNSKFNISLNSSKLLIKNMKIDDKDSSIKKRSEEHIQCNDNGEIIGDGHFKLCNINEIVLPPLIYIVNEIENNNKDINII